MKDFVRTIVTAIVISLFALPAEVLAEPGTPAFARISEDVSGRPEALQVAIAHYWREVDGRKQRVDLVGAVHVAEPFYYAGLNERFADYDAVLYELVAPQGVKVEPDAEPKGWLSKLQLAMTGGLDLAFQLESIDYLADNFVHADLSPDEFSRAMKDRGESPIVLAWRIFSYSLREGAVSSLPHRQAEVYQDLFGYRTDTGIKIMLARELTRADNLQELFGDDAGNTIIGARNERAIDVLKEQLAQPRNDRLAIFYGVAHLPDFHRRLTQSLELRYEGITWLDAWVLQ